MTIGSDKNPLGLSWGLTFGEDCVWFLGDLYFENEKLMLSFGPRLFLFSVG